MLPQACHRILIRQPQQGTSPHDERWQSTLCRRFLLAPRQPPDNPPLPHIGMVMRGRRRHRRTETSPRFSPCGKEKARYPSPLPKKQVIVKSCLLQDVLFQAIVRFSAPCVIMEAVSNCSRPANFHLIMRCLC